MLVSDAAKIIIGVVLGVLLGTYLPHLDGGGGGGTTSSVVSAPQLRQPEAADHLLMEEIVPTVAAAPHDDPAGNNQNHSEDIIINATTRGTKIQQVRGGEESSSSLVNNDDDNNAALVLKPGSSLERKLFVNDAVKAVEHELKKIPKAAKDIENEVKKLKQLAEGPIQKAIDEVLSIKTVADSMAKGAIETLKKKVKLIPTAAELGKMLENALKEFFTQEFCVPYECIVNKVLGGLEKMMSVTKSPKGGKKRTSARGSRTRKSGNLKKKNKSKTRNLAEEVDLGEIVLFETDLISISTAVEPTTCLQIEDIQFDLPKLEAYVNLFKDNEDLKRIYDDVEDFITKEVLKIDQIVDKTEPVLKTVKTGVESVKKEIDKKVKAVEDSAKWIENKLGGIDDAISNAAKNAAKSVGNTAKNTGNDAKDWACGILGCRRQLVETESGRKIPIEQLRAEVYEKGRRRLEELYEEHINRVFVERNLKENADLYISIRKLTMALTANFGQTVWVKSEGRAGYNGVIFDESHLIKRDYFPGLPFTLGMVRISAMGSFEGAMTYAMSTGGAADVQFDYNVGEAKMLIDLVNGEVTTTKQPFQTNLQATASLDASASLALNLQLASSLALCLGTSDENCITVAIDMKQDVAAGFDAMASAMAQVGLKEGGGLEKGDSLSAPLLTPMYADDLIEYGSKAACDGDLTLSAGYWQYMKQPEVTVTLTAGGGCAGYEKTLFETEPGLLQSTSDSFCTGFNVDSSDVVDSETTGSGTALTAISTISVTSPFPNSQLWEGPFDINGDGKEDLVVSSEGTLYYSLSGESEWKSFNMDADHFNGLLDCKFADFDGDGKTDALRINAQNQPSFSSGMTGEWETLNNKCEVPKDDMRKLGVGYLTPDGKASVVIAKQGANKKGVMRCSSQTNGWVQVLETTYDVDRMTFADVNGDSIDDIVVTAHYGWKAGLSKGANDKTSFGHTSLNRYVTGQQGVPSGVDFSTTKMGRTAEGKSFLLYKQGGNIYRVDLSPNGEYMSKSTPTIAKALMVTDGVKDLSNLILADFGSDDGASVYVDASQICIKQPTRHGSNCLNPSSSKKQGIINGKFCSDVRGELIGNFKCKWGFTDGKSCSTSGKDSYCVKAFDNGCVYCAE